MAGQPTTSPITLYSVKGSTLTYNEVDNNFSYLSDSIDTLNAFNSITNFALLDSTQTFTGNNIFSNIITGIDVFGDVGKRVEKYFIYLFYY